MLLVISRLFGEENGTSAVEYGLLAALIGVVGAVGGAIVGINLTTLFTPTSRTAFEADTPARSCEGRQRDSAGRRRAACGFSIAEPSAGD